MRANLKELNADYIKESLPPLDFYRHELPGAKLNKFGWNNGAICPFHNDNKAGSFYINTDTGAYKCFSCGIYGSNIISFTMALHGLSFMEALNQLADDWGLI